ncbi:MAG: hypothetical protein R3B06_17510 [Kofleriaceae bacterium]
MRTWGLAMAAAAAIVLTAPAAHADPTFDELAAQARPLSSADVAGLAWALTTPCTDGADAAQRLCRAVRDQRAAALRAGTWLVDAEAGAFSIGEWDPDAKAALIQLAGCVACTKPVGGLYLVSNKTAPSWNGDVAIAATIHQAVRAFPTKLAADKWRAVAADAHAQFVIRLLPAGGMFERDGHRGLAVEILGYRVYQRCDGAIVCASPAAQPVAVDASTCGKLVEAVSPTVVEVKPDLPAALTADDIKTVMRSVTEAAKVCFDDYGVPGKAKLVYTVTNAGTVSAYEQSGDFVDTPTGRCIDEAAKAVTFPAVKKKSFTFTYPINVQ